VQVDTRQFQVKVQTQKNLERKVDSNAEWSAKEICIGRTQGSGRKIARNELREVERLRGMKCFPSSETQFVGNTMTKR